MFALPYGEEVNITLTFVTEISFHLFPINTTVQGHCLMFCRQHTDNWTIHDKHRKKNTAVTISFWVSMKVM